MRGIFVGIKERDTPAPPPTHQHLPLALAVGGPLERGLGKLGGWAVAGLAGPWAEVGYPPGA